MAINAPQNVTDAGLDRLQLWLIRHRVIGPDAHVPPADRRGFIKLILVRLLAVSLLLPASWPGYPFSISRSHQHISALCWVVYFLGFATLMASFVFRAQWTWYGHPLKRMTVSPSLALFMVKQPDGSYESQSAIRLWLRLGIVVLIGLNPLFRFAGMILLLAFMVLPLVAARRMSEPRSEESGIAGFAT